MYRNQTNPSDEEAMEMSLSGQAPPGLRVQSVTVNNWKLNSYMAGLGTISEVSNRSLKIYTKMMIGLCHANSPSVQLTITDGATQVTVNQLSAEANNFAALFGVGFRIYLGKSVDLMLSGDYFITHLEFEDVMLTAPGQGNTNIGKLKQDVDMMSVSAGIVFKL